jgi:hypothetical protein
VSTLSRRLRWFLPFAVSGTILAVLLSRIEARSVLDHLSPRVATVFLPVLLLFGAGSLVVEGLSLQRLVPASGWWTLARLKAATYPLVLVHLAAGATALAVLVARRARLKAATAAGVVMLVSFLDLTLLALLATLGAALLGSEAVAIRAGVVAVASVAVVGGLALLRLPAALGPLERLRLSKVLAPARTTPAAVLAELAVLRLLFVAGFVAVVWAALTAFGVEVPLTSVVVNVVALALVAALPIAVAGLGTGQLAFVYLFRHWAESDALLACSLTLSTGLIVMRAAMGLLFAGELTREALREVREQS